jgi:hypothetical protein
MNNQIIYENINEVALTMAIIKAKIIMNKIKEISEHK